MNRGFEMVFAFLALLAVLDGMAVSDYAAGSSGKGIRSRKAEENRFRLKVDIKLALHAFTNVFRQG